MAATWSVMWQVGVSLNIASSSFAYTFKEEDVLKGDIVKYIYVIMVTT